MNEETKDVQTTVDPNIDELNKKLADLESTKNNLVSELQEDRKKRQELQEQIEAMKEMISKSAEKNNANPEEAKVEDLVKKILSEKDANKAVANKEAAFKKFVADHKEFDPSNDPGGLKQAALKEKFNRFNTNGLSEVEDFYAVITDAKALLGGHDTSPQADLDENPDSSITRSAPQVGGNKKSELSTKEQKLIRDNGWTEERYLKVKTSQPTFVADLLKTIRD